MNRGKRNREMERNPKSISQFGLQAETRLHSLVIAGQHTAVNTFPGLVHTARHTTKVIHTRSRLRAERNRPSKVGAMIGVKS